MRKLATWTGAFACGIFLAQYLLKLDWLIPAAIAVLLLGVLALLLREPARLKAVLVCTAVSMAFGYNWIYTVVVQMPAQAMAESTLDAVTMTLCDYPTATAYGAKVTVLPEIEGLRGVRAVYYGKESLLELAPGYQIKDDIHLKNAAKIQEDEITAFTSRGVFLLAYSKGKMESDDSGSRALRWWPLRMGRAMQEKITELYSDDSAGFLAAILTGDTSKITEAASGDLSEAGIYHIMAVSGMHCAFLLALIVFLTGRQHRHLTACVAIPILIFYALLTGARPSVIRACVMLILLLLAPLMRREGDPPTALSMALFLILLQNPFAAASISLQLSFGAVAGILWLTPKLERWLRGEKQRGKIWRLVAASFSATCGALIFTLPLSAYYFRSLVLVSPISNFLCLWAVSGAFAVGLISVLLGFLWVPAGAALAVLAKGLICYILFIVDGLSKIPYHALYYTNPFLKYWLVYFYIMLGTAYFCKPKARRTYAVASVLSAISLLVTVKLGEFYYSAGSLDIVAVDVGQGACTVMASGGQYALMDCGSANSWMGAGSDAADQLSSMGCSNLDYLILSHYDYDHVSGVSQLMNRMHVQILLVPDYQDDANLRETIMLAAHQNGTKVEFVTKEETRLLGNCTLNVYPPLGNDNDNNQSLTVHCSAGDFDLLITGDMDACTERTLLETYQLPDIEVLAVGHHGSKYSTDAEFLEVIKPEIGIISVGRNNYGHPADEVLWRLSQAGVTVYRTDLQGSIHVAVK